MFPTPRREANRSNLDVLNAPIYLLENGCKWRCLPKEYGNWDIIYVRLRRWSKKGALKAFLLLQEKNIIQISMEIISLDSTGIKVHPDGTGALKNMENRQSDNPVVAETPNFIWSLSDRDAVAFSLGKPEMGHRAASFCLHLGAHLAKCFS